MDPFSRSRERESLTRLYRSGVAPGAGPGSAAGSACTCWSCLPAGRVPPEHGQRPPLGDSRRTVAGEDPRRVLSV